jgi:hypothetical protein
LIIARRFNAGCERERDRVPDGTPESAERFYPSRVVTVLRLLVGQVRLRRTGDFSRIYPALETPGYCQSSLWDSLKFGFHFRADAFCRCPAAFAWTRLTGAYESVLSTTVFFVLLKNEMIGHAGDVIADYARE